MLDLSGWDAARDGPVALNGQWEFYWDRMLTPDDFRPGGSPPRPSGYLDIPGFWGGYELDGRRLPSVGAATLRLRILPGPGERRWEMQLFSIAAAYRLWANGRLIAKSGAVGRMTEEEESTRIMEFTVLESDGRPLDLVFQISNHAFRRGGVQFPIMIAQPGLLKQEHASVWCWSMLFVGGLLSISMYHFFLFFLRKKDRSTLYVGIYSLLLIGMFSTMDSSDWLVNIVFPDIDSVRISNFGLICFAIGSSIT